MNPTFYKLKYYTWGDEELGKVRIYVTSKEGINYPLGQINKENLPPGVVYDCPFS